MVRGGYFKVMEASLRKGDMKGAEKESLRPRIRCKSPEAAKNWAGFGAWKVVACVARV